MLDYSFSFLLSLVTGARSRVRDEGLHLLSDTSEEIDSAKCTSLCKEHLPT
jgi:hypothetical protein